MIIKNIKKKFFFFLEGQLLLLVIFRHFTRSCHFTEGDGGLVAAFRRFFSRLCFRLSDNQGGKSCFFESAIIQLIIFLHLKNFNFYQKIEKKLFKKEDII